MHTNLTPLREYLKTLPKPGGVAEFALRLGISWVYLYQLAARQDGRVPSTKLAWRIEKESGFAVRRWDLRPDDWWEEWPDLVGAEGAPTVPALADGPDAARAAA